MLRKEFVPSSDCADHARSGVSIMVEGGDCPTPYALRACLSGRVFLERRMFEELDIVVRRYEFYGREE